MNKYNLLLLYFMLYIGCAGTLYRADIPTEEKIYTTIIEHNKSKNEAYRIINEWVALNYQSSKDVVQLRNKSNGVIILKPVVKYVVRGVQNIYHPYNLTFRSKNNKTKIKIEILPLPEGAAYGNAYPPINNMPEIKSVFNGIFNNIKRPLIGNEENNDF